MNLAGTVKMNRKGGLLILCLILLVIVAWTRSGSKQGDDNTLVSGKRLLMAAVSAAEAGGAAIRARVKSESAQDVQMKKGGEPVTDADVASHCAMYSGLESLFPGVHLRSEERPPPEACEGVPKVFESSIGLEGLDKIDDEFFDSKDISIWIDPLDATKEFTEKLYQYVTTMVCVAVGGVPLMGAIHRPFHEKGETSWAWTGRLISPGLRSKKAAEDQTAGAPTKAIFSMSHKGSVEEFVKRAFGSDSKLVSAAGSGYKVLEVVGGRADVYVHTTAIKKWDICAGNAILNAVGGRMTTLDDENVTYFYDSDEYNKNGLLSSLERHDYYVKKVEAVRKNKKIHR